MKEEQKKKRPRTSKETENLRFMQHYYCILLIKYFKKKRQEDDEEKQKEETEDDDGNVNEGNSCELSGSAKCSGRIFLLLIFSAHLFLVKMTCSSKNYIYLYYVHTDNIYMSDFFFCSPHSNNFLT